MDAAKIKRITIILGTLSVVMLAVLIAIPIIKSLSVGAFLDISVAPHTAVVEINGVKYSNGSYAVEPGEYMIKISASGFDDKTVKLKVEARKENRLLDYLMPESGDIAYYEGDAVDLEILRKIETTEVQDFLREYDKKLEIKKQLPMVANYNENADGGAPSIVPITIKDGSSDVECQHAFCLLAEGGLGHESRVRDFLRDNGFSSEDYQIVYRHYSI